MEEIRWHLLWKQMSPEEQWLCVALLALIVARLAYKLLAALGVLGGEVPAAVASRGEQVGGGAAGGVSGAVGEDEDEWGKKGAPPGGKRLRVAAAFIAALAALCPVWLGLTTKWRAALPFAAMDAERGRATAAVPEIPLKLHVTIMRADGNSKRIVSGVELWAREAAAAALREYLTAEVQAGAVPQYAWSITAAVTTPDSPSPAAEAPDAEMDTWLLSQLSKDSLHGQAAPGYYHLVLLEGSKRPTRARIVLGQHRHAWVHGLGDIIWMEQMMVPVVGDCATLAVRHFGRGWNSPGGFVGPFKHWPVPAEGKVHLSFSVVNAAPSPGHAYSWGLGGGTSAHARWLAPLAKALSSVAEVTTESQTLYGTATRARAPFDAEAGAYVLDEAELPLFIDAEWPLDSAVAPPDVRLLRFVVYVPAREQCPLRVRRRDGSLAPHAAFTVPGWGGLVVWNPPACQAEAESEEEPQGAGSVAEGDPAAAAAPEATAAAGGAQDLDDVALAEVMRAAAAQLRQLFGLPPGPPRGVGGSFEISGVPAAAAAVAQWEADVLARQQLVQAHAAAVESLGSLGDVVRAIPNIVLEPALATHLSAAVHALREARTVAGRGTHEAAVRAATEAHAHAERAFFHPSILSLLYFPGEHKLAVYLPLGLPVLLSLTIRAVQELLRWRRRRGAALAARKTK